MNECPWDSGGQRWTVVDSGGQRWTAVDSGGQRWTVVDSGGMMTAGGNVSTVRSRQAMYCTVLHCAPLCCTSDVTLRSVRAATVVVEEQ
jgi:hypothetical protein